MTRREWWLRRRAIAFWLVPLALVVAGTVSLALVTDRPGPHRRVLHGRGTTPVRPPADTNTDTGTGTGTGHQGGLESVHEAGHRAPRTAEGSGTTTVVQPGAGPNPSKNHRQAVGHGNGSVVSHPARGAFGVTVGTLRGLYPGKVVDLPVSYTNPHSYAIRVTSARVAATLVSSSQGVPVCRSSHLASAPWSSSAGLLVSRHGSAETTLPIRLEAGAPDACKGSRWRLTVTAEAVHG